MQTLIEKIQEAYEKLGNKCDANCQADENDSTDVLDAVETEAGNVSSPQIIQRIQSYYNISLMKARISYLYV